MSGSSMHGYADLERLVQLEEDVRYQELATDQEPEFRYVPGRMPVLLSAPHGAVHVRNGMAKAEDEYTSGLCLFIAEKTGAHALYARRRSQTDPNWYRDVAYKRCLGRIVDQAGIRFVLDVHAAHARRDFGVALGTMCGTSCPEHREQIIEVFERHGIRREGVGLDRLDVDNLFTAHGLRGQETITRYVWKGIGIQAAQIELHPRLRIVVRRQDATFARPFRGDPERIVRAAQALAALVATVDDE